MSISASALPGCGVLAGTATLGSFANSCGNTTPNEGNDADATTARANAASYESSPASSALADRSRTEASFGFLD